MGICGAGGIPRAEPSRHGKAAQRTTGRADAAYSFRPAAGLMGGRISCIKIKISLRHYQETQRPNDKMAFIAKRISRCQVRESDFGASGGPLWPFGFELDFFDDELAPFEDLDLP